MKNSNLIFLSPVRFVFALRLFICLMVFSTPNHAQTPKGKTLPTEIKKKIDALAIDYSKINIRLRMNFGYAIENVDRALEKNLSSRTEINKWRFGLSFSNIAFSAIESLEKVSPIGSVISGVTSLLWDTKNDYEEERENLKRNKSLNSFKDIINELTVNSAKIFPTDPSNGFKLKFEKKYWEDPKNAISNLEKTRDFYRVQKDVDLVLSFQKSIFEELVSELEKENISAGGFFVCTVKSTQTCYFKEWYENKNNCAVLREVKFGFNSVLGENLNSLMNYIITKTKTESKKSYQIFDFNIPVTYKIYQPYNPGYYLLKSNLTRKDNVDNKTIFYDHENIIAVAPKPTTDALESVFTDVNSHVKSFYETTDSYGIDLPVFDSIIKKIRSTKIDQTNKIYLKGSKL